MISRLTTLGAVAVGLLLSAPLPAQTPTPPDTPSLCTTNGKDVLPPAVIAMREEWLNPRINAFTFRDTKAVFEFRDVPRGGPVLPLSRAGGFAMPRDTFGGADLDYDAFAERTFTNAFLVIRDGKILFEDYRNRSDAATHFISFSMAKSITSTLIGIALDKGQIRSLDDRASDYVPELKGTGYDGVSLRHILQMRSGTTYEERYDFGEHPSLAARVHNQAIVRNLSRFADFTACLKNANPPGSTFNYATMDTAVLGWVLERATHRKLADFTRETLWQPLGAEADAWWLADGVPGIGRELSGMGYNATLRDFGRLGLLWLNKGRSGTTQIVSSRYVEQATAMIPFAAGTPGSFKGYGFQFWKVDDEPGAFAAVGLAGQFIYVHPQTNTVIVKLSYYPPGPDDAIQAEVVDYFRAIVHSR